MHDRTVARRDGAVEEPACILCLGLLSVSKISQYMITMVEHWPILSVPVVHLVPVHPVAQLQELGAIHVPPFGHDVTPEHRAETQIKPKLNIVQLKIAIEHSYHDSLSPHILNSRYYMTADDRQCMPAYCKWKTRFCRLFQVLDVLCRQVLFVTVTF